MRKVVVKMIKLLDKMFDSFLYWLERVQWNRDSRRRKRKYKKQSKENSKIQDRLKNAEKLLRDNGYVFERDWQDIYYKGEKYTPIMIEEHQHFGYDTIIITARKYEQGN